MGVVVMPSYKDYWKTSYSYGKIADVMQIKRFQQIRRYSYVDAYPVESVKGFHKKSKGRIDVPCPQIVRHYNRHMGGVNLADMLIALYRTIQDSVSEEKKIKKPATERLIDAIRYDAVDHWPEHTEYQRCKYCKKGQASTRCTKCNVHLCYVAKRNCFVAYRKH
ncbi:hypothetical protein HF086_015622 [Spodoptera exigua]|uniref:PiggyBac transposable element-derived protein domain-containing protein n=1 Tax=Spodoptera exigua TaxID=7107 RepID=A0A922MRC0_SPOEX|nr:hypothetical protein HF086_015622 [Spodoptera exigua]